MAQFLVRNLEDSVKSRLKRRAERHGRSMEEEVRQILRNATREDSKPRNGLGSRIASRFANSGLTDELTELRGTRAKPADFRK
jgi:plasmid stability protein